MYKFLRSRKLFAASIVPILVEGVKIAFVGDTGMEDDVSWGYGLRTMKMIEGENVDLVVDVGDFDYWGRCTETYEVESSLKIDSLIADSIEVPYKSTLKRIKWQDGRHGSIEGWEIGVQTDLRDHSIVTSKKLTIDGDLFQRHVVTDETWEEIEEYLKLQKGERDCYGEPWDGPWAWNQFLRDHSFAFLGASGNAEVKEAPLYGSAEIWSSHQEYMHDLYMERIYKTNRGACHGYDDQTEPGTVTEYGERFSCYYNNNRGKEDFQFLLLGWWQGSNERTDNKSKENRKKTIEFIEREFSDKRSKKVRWRFCIHHMTSAKLSSGDKNRDSMVLARITDTCRKYGAIIISGHHHLYSRTAMLQSVGSEQGKDPIPIRDAREEKSKFAISEGLTMSITAGMGGYDGGCNGKYWNATWMEKCIARPSDHRGAIIAEFDEKNTRIGNFRYMNSMKSGEIADEFQITSRLPGSLSKAPTNEPSRKPTRRPTPKPTESPSRSMLESLNDSKITLQPSVVSELEPSPVITQKPEPVTKQPSVEPSLKLTVEPSSSTSQNVEPTAKNPTGIKKDSSGKPTMEPSQTPSPNSEPITENPTKIEKDSSNNPQIEPTQVPSRKPESTANRPTENKKEYLESDCISVMDLLCSVVSFSSICELIHEFDVVDSFAPNSDVSLTVFAPVNEAFEYLTGNTEFDFRSLTSKQSAYVLSYHVIATETDPFTFADLECGSTTQTVNGENTRTKCSGDKKYQRGPKQIDDKIPLIILPNISVCNGLVHAVD
eukprot:CAMPEP_0197174330 /NCGR_PEP_ID=MMETSP1423-20130617/899_1 /TAXON_ID=476441 /ORGANISM="Pseudo-nitzschia heimii, Strain UNC1101" /LENGTH=771 /DNA_ID=CAMNT_0042623247 /DNA_START=107 /DNA_END=2419 /DNA_ORIENTATION=-